MCEEVQMNVITPPNPTPMSKKATKVRGRLPSVCQLQEVPGNSGRLEMLNLLTLWFPRVDMVWPLHEHSNQLTTSNLFVGSKKQ